MQIKNFFSENRHERCLSPTWTITCAVINTERRKCQLLVSVSTAFMATSGTCSQAFWTQSRPSTVSQTTVPLFVPFPVGYLLNIEESRYNTTGDCLFSSALQFFSLTPSNMYRSAQGIFKVTTRSSGRLCLTRALPCAPLDPSIIYAWTFNYIKKFGSALRWVFNSYTTLHVWTDELISNHSVTYFVPCMKTKAKNICWPYFREWGSMQSI